MAALMKHHNNISIQPLKVVRSSTKNKFVLSNDNITKDEIYQKSTSDKTKQRVAHVAKFPVPVIREPIPVMEKQENLKQKKANQKKNKLKKPIVDKPKKAQNLGNQHLKMKKLKNFIGSIPWAYSDVYSGRTISEKRKSDDSEILTAKAKKQKN